MSEIIFSIIIPFRKPSTYLFECLEAIKNQSFPNFEVILLPDRKFSLSYPAKFYQISSTLGPAGKRDLGARIAKGKFLAFIDDDAFPARDWLKNALSQFAAADVAAVCGPGITPASDNLRQQAGGWVNSLWLGSGGAGTYRFIPQKRQMVDDYPSMNFIVRKDDFRHVGGFDTHYWPGEDTKLCFDLVYKSRKVIIYSPLVLVYHHRRPLFIPHLKQISRYAIHRGYFAKILPRTSLRLGYLIPSLFVLFLFTGLLFFQYDTIFIYIYISVVGVYLLLLIVNMAYVMFKTGGIFLALLSGLGIFMTHLTYGTLFPVGFFKKTLKQ